MRGNWGTNGSDGRVWSISDDFVLVVREDRTGVVINLKHAELYVRSLESVETIERALLERELLRYGIRLTAVENILTVAANERAILGDFDNGLPALFELAKDGEVETLLVRRSGGWKALRARLIEQSRIAS